MRPLLEMVRRTARQLIRRVPTGSVMFEDLYSAGLLALVEAARRYDPSRGVEFRPFALYRIRGAMIDELRQLDTVSRERRTAIRHGVDAPDAPPCPRLVELSAAAAIADPSPDIEDRLTRRQWIARLRAAESRLPERLRLVLHLRLEADWSLREIADHLGVTQGRACQLVGKGVQRLRKALKIDQQEMAA